MGVVPVNAETVVVDVFVLVVAETVLVGLAVLVELVMLVSVGLDYLFDLISPKTVAGLFVTYPVYLNLSLPSASGQDLVAV